jgi:hypothetical protein
MSTGTETYSVAPGQYESIYANMPRFGLGVAAEHVPVVGRPENARSRMTTTPSNPD